MKLIVHRIERHVQPVEVEVPDDLPEEEQARQARELVADDQGDEIGTLEYHSTDDSPENWSVYKKGKQIG